MNNDMNANIEPRKEWVALELKKIDIETVTAAEDGTGIDGGSFS
jgi:hypothetical protein